MKTLPMNICQDVSFPKGFDEKKTRTPDWFRLLRVEVLLRGKVFNNESAGCNQSGAW